ncbi:MAG TPA: c-type cytochrome [Gammaproteobacteria bacterium]|nr:c-type cytochrome [Gammaproteobacteria bacterium]
MRCLATQVFSAMVVGTLVGAAAQAQPGPYTEQQAAAGRASYQANCAGCHQADLRGSN